MEVQLCHGFSPTLIEKRKLIFSHCTEGQLRHCASNLNPVLSVGYSVPRKGFVQARQCLHMALPHTLSVCSGLRAGKESFFFYFIANPKVWVELREIFSLVTKLFSMQLEALICF